MIMFYCVNWYCSKIMNHEFLSHSIGNENNVTSAGKIKILDIRLLINFGVMPPTQAHLTVAYIQNKIQINTKPTANQKGKQIPKTNTEKYQCRFKKIHTKKVR